MSEYSFFNIFKEKYKPNCYLGIANNITTSEQQKEFITKLSENSNVKEVNLTYQNKATYDSLLNTLQLVVIVLVLFAGALEITSIYSLTNINVSERSREIATLKVLGYRRREVVGYIYRETTILAIVGTLFGFFLGFLFHKFVVSMMQMPGMSIGYIISPWSYLIAFVISLGFFAIVDLIFFPKINNLSMIESLKSVE
jgi:putative ABC transport system permease protein